MENFDDYDENLQFKENYKVFRAINKKNLFIRLTA